MTDKPLHVQVAEALGTVGSLEVPPFYYVTPAYDTSWEATGPLIERFRLILRAAAGGSWAARKDNDFQPGQEYHGSTPLIAVCNLILALHTAGKLPK